MIRRFPEWLPPSVSVHRNEWKLIRIFFGGDKGQHRWKLFNLRDDIGEQNDLSASRPEMVRELDALIEDFLVDTNAVRAVANPDFDRESYRLEDEGVQQRKKPQQTPGPKLAKQKPVAGWQASADCTLALEQNSMTITSRGRDPHLSFALPKTVAAENLTLTLMMSSKASGFGQVFWKEQGVNSAFMADHSQKFKVENDGQPHEYAIKLSATQPVSALRIDPAQSPGEIQLLSAKLVADDGRVVRSWSFANNRK